MSQAKTVKLFLMDGSPNKGMTCELSNWTGKAYKLPVDEIEKCSNRRDLKGTAVYMLFGLSDDVNKKNKIYIGEAENIYNRLCQHKKQKTFWNEAIVFISKDENLNKAHIKYLEARLYEIASSVDRFEIMNCNTPTKSAISESEMAEMEEFITNVIMLTDILNYKPFETVEKNTGKEDLLYIRTAVRNSVKGGLVAEGKVVPEGFWVFKGSGISEIITPSFPTHSMMLRKKLIQEKHIENINNGYIFTEDYLFNSSSSAANIILGKSSNGLIEWFNYNGKSLKELMDD